VFLGHRLARREQAFHQPLRMHEQARVADIGRMQAQAHQRRPCLPARSQAGCQRRQQPPAAVARGVDQ